MTAVRLFGPEKSTSPLISWTSRLDGILARFRLQYIKRCDEWDLRVADAAGDVIIAGQRIVVGWDMWQPYNDSRLPPGSLVVVDSEGKYDDLPRLDGWQERYWWMYTSPSDIEPSNDLLVTQVVSQ